MDFIKSLNGIVNNFVWGIPMMVLIVGTGVYLTIRSRGVQISRFGYAIKHSVGSIFKKPQAGSGEVTPFQAVSMALAATAGTGNIAGVTTAIVLGGPGAIFWLWVTAIIGMCTKYAEVLLSIKFRRRNDRGDWVGGPMYYIIYGLGKNWKWLSVLFCVFGALAAFGIGNAVQIGNMTASINTAITAFYPAFTHVSAANWTIGIIVALLVGLTLLGGIKRIGSVAEYLVPVMSIIFIVGSIVVVAGNIERLGGVFAMIIEGAFRPSAAVGGAAGFTLMRCVEWGVKRGVFSNEAGLGSAPIAHAATSESNPVKQGMFGIFEVFIDTIVMCTLTGVTLLISGIVVPYGDKAMASSALNSAAFATVMGDKLGSLTIAVGITLFALATVLSWGLYGTRCCEFLLGTRSIKPYQVLFTLVVIVGATMELSLAWDIADTLNGLMAIPNLIALLGLSGIVAKLTREHFSNRGRLK